MAVTEQPISQDGVMPARASVVVAIPSSSLGADGSLKSSNWISAGAYQQLGSAAIASAAGLTVPSGARFAMIQNNGTQAVRWRDDGTNPTSSTGQRIAADGQYFVYDGNLSAIKFIREADGAILDISYYK